MARRPNKAGKQNGHVAIPCTVGALYDEGDIMVVVDDTADQRPVVTWVPKEDITIVEQPLRGVRLRGVVKGEVVDTGSAGVQVRLGKGQGSGPFWVPRDRVLLG